MADKDWRVSQKFDVELDEWDRIESADASGANGFSRIQMEERLVIEILYLYLPLYRNL